MSRLIDADALIRKIEERYVDACIQVNTRRNGKSIHYGIALGMNRARNEIIEQPTVDATPVMHGRFGKAEIVGYDGYHAVYACKCSVCGEYTQLFRPNYCPNCGAKMDLR